MVKKKYCFYCCSIYIYIYINFFFFESLVKSNFLKRIKKALNLQQIKKNEIVVVVFKNYC